MTKTEANLIFRHLKAAHNEKHVWPVLDSASLEVTK